MLLAQKNRLKICSEQKNQLFINIKQDTENNSQSGWRTGVLARFHILPDSDRWIEPRTLSGMAAVIFSFQFISDLAIRPVSNRKYS